MTIKVKELIELLKKFDDEKDVYVVADCFHQGFTSVTNVELDKDNSGDVVIRVY